MSCEAHMSADGGATGSRISEVTTDSPTSHPNSTEPVDEPSSLPTQGSYITSNEGGGKGVAEPWRPDGPYRTKIPQSQTTMEDWLKAMEASDDGMCKGWRDQIDTLIIFAGLFSATVTAFTIESYQWLDETPANTLARLQLRALLNMTHDPAIDRLAPAIFHVSPSSVLVNALWFTSLALALAAVVISILCKQWLYEYQRYDNLTTKVSFLIRGLRYRGLQAWRVPTIIASLPILLQLALVLFLIGLHILLRPLQPIVGSIVAAIVGLILLFLAATTILPSIQYIYPKFDTQCAYKSSQSWSFFVISAFWLFDFSMFTNWATFDRWEVTCVYNGMGRTLSRVYELLSNSVDAFHSIYSVLADTSLRPTIKADLTLLSDFVGGLDATRRNFISEEMTQTNKRPEVSQRIEQLKSYIDQYYSWAGKLKPAFRIMNRKFQTSFGQHETTPNRASHLRIQETFIQFLKSDTHFSDPVIFNRYVEHLTRSIDKASDGEEMRRRDFGLESSCQQQWRKIFWVTRDYSDQRVRWDPDIASYFVEIQSHLFKTGQFPKHGIMFIADMYPDLVKTHRQHDFNPPPFTLLKDVQDWIGGMRESDLYTKVCEAEDVLDRMIYRGCTFVDFSHASDLEITYLRSFAQFFVDFYRRADVLDIHRKLRGTPERVEGALAELCLYLGQNLSRADSS